MATAKSTEIRAHVASFQTQKSGNSGEENDDACAPTGSQAIRSGHLRVAVSDGATEGFLSGPWATQLVEEFVARRTLDVNRLTAHTRGRWRDWLHCYLEDRSRMRPIQWYEEPGLEQGAFASLLGLHIEARPRGHETGRWSAVAVGDTCLFHVRDSNLLASFPLTSSSDFENSPALVASNPLYAHPDGVATICRQTGEWRTDDILYLATDSMALWLFTQVERRNPPWEILRDLDTEDQAFAFDEWITDLRAKGEVKNDDMTLVRVDLH